MVLVLGWERRFTEAGADTCVSPSDLRFGRVASQLPFVDRGVIYGRFTFPTHAGGHSGPPLRGGFVSKKASLEPNQTAQQTFRNIRRDRYKRDASTRQAATPSQ